jgi:hypothetical protein
VRPSSAARLVRYPGATDSTYVHKKCALPTEVAETFTFTLDSAPPLTPLAVPVR